MAREKYPAKTPIIGMFLVFAAMAIVAVTAYQRAGWLSIIGYAIAAFVAIFGFWFTFRDLPDAGPPGRAHNQPPRRTD